MGDRTLAHASPHLANQRRRNSLWHALTYVATSSLRHSLAHVTTSSPAAQPRSRERERWQARGEPPAAARTRQCWRTRGCAVVA